MLKFADFFLFFFFFCLLWEDFFLRDHWPDMREHWTIGVSVCKMIIESMVGRVLYLVCRKRSYICDSFNIWYERLSDQRICSSVYEERYGQNVSVRVDLRAAIYNTSECLLYCYHCYIIVDSLFSFVRFPLLRPNWHVIYYKFDAMDWVIV